MTFVRRWKWTLTATGLLTGVILWLALTGQPWTVWAGIAAIIGTAAYRGFRD